MKEKEEKEEISFSRDYSINDKQITNNSIIQYRNLLENKDYVTISIKKYFKLYINITTFSFIKINQMIESYPEENIVFICNQKILYTPRDSSNFSRLSQSSINSNRSSLISGSDLKKGKIKEEIINTDIKTTPEIPKKIDINHNNNSNNLRNTNKKNNNTDINNGINNKKFLIFKWIFHFYFIIGLIILIDYISFFFSHYKDYNYKWFSLMLIISLIFIGYTGIKKRNSYEQKSIFNDRNLFWAHLIIFSLTIVSFFQLIKIGGFFEFIKQQGIIGYLIVFIYLLALIVEGIMIIFYDVIIRQLENEKIYNSNKIEESNRNNLGRNLLDIN